MKNLKLVIFLTILTFFAPLNSFAKEEKALFEKLPTPNFVNLNFASFTKFDTKDTSKNSYSTKIFPSSLSYGYKFKFADVDKIVFGPEVSLNYFGSDLKANINNVAADIDLNYSYGIKAFIGVELFKNINFFYKTGYSRVNLDLAETGSSTTVSKTKSTYNFESSLSLEISNPKKNKDIYYIIEYAASDFGRIKGNIANAGGGINKYKISSDSLRAGIGFKF